MDLKRYGDVGAFLVFSYDSLFTDGISDGYRKININIKEVHEEEAFTLMSYSDTFSEAKRELTNYYNSKRTVKLIVKPIKLSLQKSITKQVEVEKGFFRKKKVLETKYENVDAELKYILKKSTSNESIYGVAWLCKFDSFALEKRPGAVFTFILFLGETGAVKLAQDLKKDITILRKIGEQLFQREFNALKSGTHYENIPLIVKEGDKFANVSIKKTKPHLDPELKEKIKELDQIIFTIRGEYGGHSSVIEFVQKNFNPDIDEIETFWEIIGKNDDNIIAVQRGRETKLPDKENLLNLYKNLKAYLVILEQIKSRSDLKYPKNDIYIAFKQLFLNSLKENSFKEKLWDLDRL